MYLGGGTVRLTNDTLTSNTARGNDGAQRVRAQAPIAPPSSGAARAATAEPGARVVCGQGGGVYAAAGTLTLSTVQLSLNTAAGRCWRARRPRGCRRFAAIHPRLGNRRCRRGRRRRRWQLTRWRPVLLGATLAVEDSAFSTNQAEARHGGAGGDGGDGGVAHDGRGLWRRCRAGRRRGHRQRRSSRGWRRYGHNRLDDIHRQSSPGAAGGSARQGRRWRRLIQTYGSGGDRGRWRSRRQWRHRSGRRLIRRRRNDHARRRLCYFQHGVRRSGGHRRQRRGGGHAGWSGYIGGRSWRLRWRRRGRWCRTGRWTLCHRRQHRADQQRMRQQRGRRRTGCLGGNGGPGGAGGSGSTSSAAANGGAGGAAGAGGAGGIRSGRRPVRQWRLYECDECHACIQCRHRWRRSRWRQWRRWRGRRSHVQQRARVRAVRMAAMAAGAAPEGQAVAVKGPAFMPLELRSP